MDETLFSRFSRKGGTRRAQRLVGSLATAALTTKPSAWHRRPAECGRRIVAGTEAFGFVCRRSAVRTPSGCAAPTDTNAARGADTKGDRVLRRSTKRLRDFSRMLSLRKRSVFAVVGTQPNHRSCTRSHGGTEFLDMKHRGSGESLFVNRWTGERLSCRTEGAHSCRRCRENPKGEAARVAADDAAGIWPEGVRVASIAQCAISRQGRFVVARSAKDSWRFSMPFAPALRQRRSRALRLKNEVQGRMNGTSEEFGRSFVSQSLSHKRGARRAQRVLRATFEE